MCLLTVQAPQLDDALASGRARVESAVLVDDQDSSCDVDWLCNARLAPGLAYLPDWLSKVEAEALVEALENTGER